MFATVYTSMPCRSKPGFFPTFTFSSRSPGLPPLPRAPFPLRRMLLKVRGDQYVTVQIQVPEHLSGEAKRKLSLFSFFFLFHFTFLCFPRFSCTPCTVTFWQIPLQISATFFVSCTFCLEPLLFI